MRRHWPAIVRRFDRPRRRALLVVPGSIWVSARYHAPAVVYWRDGTWIHWYRGAKIPHAELGRAAPPSVLTAEARKLFLHEYTPRPGDTVFDLGAGIGAEALVFSRLVGDSGRVVSAEAHPRTFARLARLCEVNGLTNVTPLQVAVADADGTVTISDTDQYLQNAVVGEGGIEVPANRIDTIAAELGVGHVDLLKMNIEGAERAALEGMGRLIAATRHVCISCHDFLADNGGPDELRTKAFVIEFLTEHGFDVRTRDDALEPWTRDYVYGKKA